MAPLQQLKTEWTSNDFRLRIELDPPVRGNRDGKPIEIRAVTVSVSKHDPDESIRPKVMRVWGTNVKADGTPGRTALPEFQWDSKRWLPSGVLSAVLAHAQAAYIDHLRREVGRNRDALSVEPA